MRSLNGVLQYFLYILIISITLLSCNRQFNQTNGDSAVLNIPRKGRILSSNLESKITKIIPLETNDVSLISYVSKMTIKNNRIYILDKYKIKALLVFDSVGNHIFSINRKGNGPGEISYPRDFFVDKDDNIDILDIFSWKLMSFDKFGRFLNKVDINIPSKGFIKISPSNYIFYTANVGRIIYKNKSINHNLLFYNRQKGIYLQLDKYLGSGLFFELPGNGLFENYQGDILYRTSGDCTIYEINNKTIIPKFKLNFNGRYIPLELVKSIEESNRNLKQSLTDSGYVYWIVDFFELQDFIYLSFVKANNAYSCLFMKNNMQLLFYDRYDNFMNKHFHTAEARIVSSLGNSLIAVISPDAILLKEKQNIQNNLLIELQTKLNNIEETDNPIIIFTEFLTNKKNENEVF